MKGILEWTDIGETVEKEDKLYIEVKTVREFTYLGDGGCEAAVTARTPSLFGDTTRFYTLVSLSLKQLSFITSHAFFP